MPRNGAGAVLSQIVIIGAPLATKAISVPAPSPISILPATRACAILLPPPKSWIFSVSPCFLKIPSSSPTLTGMIASDVAFALPTESVVSADEGGGEARNNAKAMMTAVARYCGFAIMLLLPFRARLPAQYRDCSSVYGRVGMHGYLRQSLGKSVTVSH